MTVDLNHLLTRSVRDEPVQWQGRDVALYAIGCGLGREGPVDAESAFIRLGPELKVLPTFASLLGSAALLEACGLSSAELWTVAEHLLVHRPLTEKGAARLDSRVTGARAVPDDGGFELDIDSDARNARGELLFTAQRTMRASASLDAGSGEPQGGAPSRRADLVCSLPVRQDQGMLYELAAEPFAAATEPASPGNTEALPGLCTFGIACRAILATICEYDVTLVRSLSGRFPARAHAGENLVTEMWQQANRVAFQVRSAERDLVVLSDGQCELAA